MKDYFAVLIDLMRSGLVVRSGGRAKATIKARSRG
jgi:hypothetical protein